MLRLVAAIMLAVATLQVSAEPLWLQLDTAATRSPRGIWRIAGDCYFSIEPRHGSDGVYDLSLWHGGDLSVESGSYFGSMRAGADARTFDASLLADPKAFANNGKSRRRDFVITFDESYSTLKIQHYNKGLIVNFIRLLPYLFRIGVEQNRRLPDGIVGATRCDGDGLEYPIAL